PPSRQRRTASPNARTIIAIWSGSISWGISRWTFSGIWEGARRTCQLSLSDWARRPMWVSWVNTWAPWRWMASAIARYAGVIESSWFAGMFHALAGDDGWTLDDPPKIVRAQPPRALPS